MRNVDENLHSHLWTETLMLLVAVHVFRRFRR